MRTRLFLCMCLVAMPLSFTGCDSGDAVQVGTSDDKAPPPDVQAQIDKRNAEYGGQMQQQINQPTPTDAPAPPAGGG